MNMWNCTNIGGVNYLKSDYTVDCDSPEWVTYALWAGGAFVMYIIGIHVLFFSLVKYFKVRGQRCCLGV